MWICKYFALFSLFSCMGWIYETIYCTLKNGKWCNRGFLFGPVCPIYGVGGVTIGIIYDYVINSGRAGEVTWWKLYIFAYLGSVVLEYVTHYVLEKRFHAYWWDYSGVPLNIHGRVCVPASIGFGCAGLLIYYVIYPPIADVTNQVPELGYELIALICMALLAADTALTVATLTNIIRNMEEMEDSINRQMELLVSNFEDRKHTMGNVLEATGERMKKEHLERTLRSMGGYKRSALTRIKGFKPLAKNGDSHSQEHLKRIWLMAKVKKASRKVRDTIQDKRKEGTE